MEKEGGLEHIILLQIKCQVKDIVQVLTSLHFRSTPFFSAGFGSPDLSGLIMTFINSA